MLGPITPSEGRPRWAGDTLRLLLLLHEDREREMKKKREE
jgi:hypothetical protein